MTKNQDITATEQQTINEVCKFLSCPAAFEGAAGNVKVIKTHAAIIFIGDDIVYKIKQPVKYDYMDFSTLAQRKAVCEKEFELNRRFAPDIYLGVVAITREANARLAIDGQGEVVEYAVKLRRFPEQNILAHIVAHGKIDYKLSAKLGRQIADYHNQLGAVKIADGATRLSGIISELARSFQSLSNYLDENDTLRFLKRCKLSLADLQPHLDHRAKAGMVRRCHGDLHLNNIVLLDEVPTLFDALEFNEELATIDVLYDLAFLIMDMVHEGQRAAANMLLCKYAVNAWPLISVSGMRVFPLFLALRAAIRAMVAAQRADRDVSQAAVHKISANSYLADACGFFAERQPVLIAVGGLSGTGKSKLARELAPDLGPLPGAIVLRSDVERKFMLGVDEFDTLQDEAYASEISKLVYDRLFNKARSILGDGHAVIIDAVFLSNNERTAATELADTLGIAFCGLWLDAPEEILLKRVNARKNDASDADAEIVQKQLVITRKQPVLPHNQWYTVNAAGDRQQSINTARGHLSALMPVDQNQSIE